MLQLICGKWILNGCYRIDDGEDEMPFRGVNHHNIWIMLIAVDLQCHFMNVRGKCENGKPCSEKNNQDV